MEHPELLVAQGVQSRTSDPYLQNTFLAAMSAAGKEKKKNKKQPTSSNTEANSSKLWPDLPKKLIYLIERQPSLYQAIFSRGVTKSWKIKPNKCNSNSTLPWLQLAIDDHEIANNYNKQPHTFNITFKRDCIWYWYRDSRPPEKLHVLGCSHGVIVSKQVPNYFNPAPNYVLRDATDEGGWYLPLWDIKHPVIYTSSSSKPSYQNKCVVIVLTGITSPAFAFYRMWGETREWMKKDSAIVDPHCSDPNDRSNLLRFTNGIWFKEKLFALSLQGTLAVIEEDIDSDVRITALSKKRAVPSVSSMHFRECLIESEGKAPFLMVGAIPQSGLKKHYWNN
ncbi:conserved hypothetical protein [Ricinus communis]|uniref:Uncharacterized protein n=1 Tax=Ricinus communis TaxID=3988 RepID=B9RX70_RICCO|nr:conserved hypothetical protein [Ricinus communis]